MSIIISPFSSSSTSFCISSKLLKHFRPQQDRLPFTIVSIFRTGRVQNKEREKWSVAIWKMILNDSTHTSRVRNRNQKVHCMSSLINKDGFLQSQSTKTADILNDQFESAYTWEDTDNIPDKGSSHHPSMRRILIKLNGITKPMRS